MNKNPPKILLEILIKKETLAQVFSCEFCKISKKRFLKNHFWFFLN